MKSGRPCFPETARAIELVIVVYNETKTWPKISEIRGWYERNSYGWAARVLERAKLDFAKTIAV